MTFHVGQKVVCIAKGRWEKTRTDFPGIIVPERGKIYTIREVYRDVFSGVTGIRLKEIVNADFLIWKGATYYIEMGWHSHEFRPLEEKKTDISIFQKILTGYKINENI